MEKSRIEAMFAEALKAKVEKSTALGTKATWSMGDHLDVAAQCIAEEAGLTGEVAIAQLREVVQATYNHSAFAQRIEKAFAKTGHFQRDRKAPQELSDVFAMLAKQVEGK